MCELADRALILSPTEGALSLTCFFTPNYFSRLKPVLLYKFDDNNCLGVKLPAGEKAAAIGETATKVINL